MHVAHEVSEAHVTQFVKKQVSHSFVVGFKNTLVPEHEEHYVNETQLTQLAREQGWQIFLMGLRK